MASWQELKCFGCPAQMVSNNRVEGFSNCVQQRNKAVSFGGVVVRFTGLLRRNGNRVLKMAKAIP